MDLVGKAVPTEGGEISLPTQRCPLIHDDERVWGGVWPEIGHPDRPLSTNTYWRVLIEVDTQRHVKTDQ